MKTSTYKRRRYTEVETANPVCDGCIFEASVFDGDCISVQRRPECNHLARKDGKSVIFKYMALKPQKK